MLHHPPWGPTRGTLGRAESSGHRHYNVTWRSHRNCERVSSLRYWCARIFPSTVTQANRLLKYINEEDRSHVVHQQIDQTGLGLTSHLEKVRAKVIYFRDTSQLDHQDLVLPHYGPQLTANELPCSFAFYEPLEEAIYSQRFARSAGGEIDFIIIVFIIM